MGEWLREGAREGARWEARREMMCDAGLVVDSRRQARSGVLEEVDRRRHLRLEVKRRTRRGVRLVASGLARWC